MLRALTASLPLRSSIAFTLHRMSSSSALSASTTTLEFPSSPSDLSQAQTLLWVGRKPDLQAAHDRETVVSPTIWKRMVEGSTTHQEDLQFTVATLPETVSRHWHPQSPHKLSQKLGSSLTEGTTVARVWGVPDAAAAMTVAAAAARAVPVYSAQTTDKPKQRTLRLECYTAEGQLVHCPGMEAAAKGVRHACRWMDLPPAELTTTQFRSEVQAWAEKQAHVSYQEIVGPDLEAQGFGGIYGVGKAAECPPALVILEYTPETIETEGTTVLVGKSIVYDTGGLSLKSKAGMPGMKHDMGGAAGLMGGFMASVDLQVPRKVVLLLCMAENAIGPAAMRNDDILTLYSGKTVEINNCDAEGRLVLGDGVAYASKHYEDCQLIVNMATLTGAQLVTTGKKHAAILANTEELEAQAMQAGKQSGDLVYPLLYAPEIAKDEFESKVADMKNSVKDRGNAQASCAGHFIESHLHKDYQGGWLHVDMAGPGSKDQRGTGYGVTLVMALLGVEGF